MLLTKASAVSNVENKVNQPKIADKHSGQEAKVSSATITPPYNLTDNKHTGIRSSQSASKY